MISKGYRMLKFYKSTISLKPSWTYSSISRKTFFSFSLSFQVGENSGSVKQVSRREDDILSRIAKETLCTISVQAIFPVPSPFIPDHQILPTRNASLFSTFSSHVTQVALKNHIRDTLPY